jgi:hypothetical protein
MENNIPEELQKLPYKWEVNPKYDVPHLGPYVYVRDGHMTIPQMGEGYYMEDKDDNVG